MAEVKWIKITVDMFDNRKIKHLRKLPEGDSIVLIWVMLLTMAGRCNSNGMIFLTENIPYTPKMLADELDFEENTVRLALDALKRFGMICTSDDGFFAISGWEKHQNIDRLAEIREYNRLAKQKSREKQKLLQEVNEMSMTSQQCHEIEEDKEEEREEDKERERDIEKIDYNGIRRCFNEICVSYPSVRSLSEARKKAIKARLKTYSVDDFKTVFEKAEASSFLKGNNNRNWTANFDWLIKDSNMAKVLDGNYDDKSQVQQRQTYYKQTKAQELDDFYAMAKEWSET